MFGSILSIIEEMMGWEWTSKFYTGYSFYGTDPYSKIKVANSFGLLRVPGLTGNYSTFVLYSLIAIVIIIINTKSKIFKAIWMTLGIICIFFLLTNRPWSHLL